MKVNSADADHHNIMNYMHHHVRASSACDFGACLVSVIISIEKTMITMTMTMTTTTATTTTTTTTTTTMITTTATITITTPTSTTMTKYLTQICL